MRYVTVLIRFYARITNPRSCRTIGAGSTWVISGNLRGLSVYGVAVAFHPASAPSTPINGTKHTQGTGQCGNGSTSIRWG